ncbi:MAG: type II toxin-antitoxin system RelE/ParE family toxin [Planctomycetota bacterium]|jgi:proteic killer suppression protein|nr:type II toxin-antitoxin system RelE/ParE family toxin [Planctomycetota bacterium]
MISSFADKETEAIFRQRFSRRLPPEIHARALVKLLLLNAAQTEDDLRHPPGNHFEHLTGDKKGRCSIRINNQWRIVFTFANGNADAVKITDYH